MMVLQAFNIVKEYEGTPVLTDISFHLAGGERVGLIGTNGCGKSTLMKILAGEMTYDGGDFHWISPSLSRAFLSQEGHWDPDRPLGEQIGPVPADLLARCGIAPALLSRKAGTLSGGQKTRAALARVLAGRPDLLLLDEPTNHLDTDGLQWLESLLASYRGTVLVVSHDRYFLDRVATRILEMENGKLKEYPGNYSAYACQKQAELERAQAEYRQYVKEKKALEEAIRRQMEWARASHNARVTSDMPINAGAYMKAQAKAHLQAAKTMEQRLRLSKVEKPREAARINLKMDDAGGVARNLILARELGFSYDGRRWLFQGADFYVQRGDRVAIVGPNGAGKSTLVKLLLGQLTPTRGSLYCTPVKVAYLAQEMETLDPGNTVLQEATGDSAIDQAAARTLLGCLLFSRDAVLKKVAVLSGGEKVRLALAKILLSAPDMLVLDEPTNGLDLPSRERVEEALESYPGTLLMVSHDRYLLRRIASRVISIDGGRLEAFTGTYDTFVERAHKPVGENLADRKLLLETRLAQLSAALAAPKPEQAAALNDEFIRVSRELRSLK